VLLVGGGILFANGMIGGGGGDSTTLKVEAPKVDVPKPDAPNSTTGSNN